MNYLTKVVGKDLLRTVYTAAMTNQVEQDHYLINPQRKIFQIMNTYIEEGIRQGNSDKMYLLLTYKQLFGAVCVPMFMIG